MSDISDMENKRANERIRQREREKKEQKKKNSAIKRLKEVLGTP